MLRGVLVIALYVCWFAAPGLAADLPDYSLLPHKPHVAKSVKVAAQDVVSKKSVSGVAAKSSKPAQVAMVQPQKSAILDASSKAAPGTRKLSSAVEVTWQLGPMVAMADQWKTEGSASTTKNLVAGQEGGILGSEATIELFGHVVKTEQTSVRLDVQIGTIKRSVVWQPSEIHSGTFRILLNDKFVPGPAPRFLPSSAFVLVTQSGSGHVALISVEKIVLRIGALPVTSQK